MNAQEIARLREVASKATKSQWAYSETREMDIYGDEGVIDTVDVMAYEDGPMICHVCDEPDENWQDNGQFIAAFNPETALRLLDELERYRGALEFYANGSVGDDHEPKPDKAHLYDKDYPMDSSEWRQRSMSDYVIGKRAREALEEK